MTQKYYWKVLRVDLEGRWHSCFVGVFSRHCLYYQKGKWTKPKLKKGKLFIFRTRKAAEAFAKYSPNIVRKCIAKGVVSPKITKIPYNNQDTSFHKFWRNPTTWFSVTKKQQKDWMSLPEKTLFASKIKIL